MKTIKSRQQYKCYACGKTINKGDQYAKKSVRLGDSGMVAHDGTVHVWEPYRAAMPHCLECIK